MYKAEWLKGFVAVANFGSFSKAARQADLSTMALSKQVAALENLLKEPLFERSTRKIRLTELGREFLPKAQIILKQHQDLAEWVDGRQQSPAGVLRILAQESEILGMTITPWLGEFCRLYPDIKLEIDVSEKLVDIEKESFDIYWGMSEYLGRQFPGLRRRTIFNSVFGIYASPEYLAFYGKPKNIADLANHKMISYLYNQPNNMLIINVPNYKGTGLPAIEMSAPIKTVQGMLELAEQGLGLVNGAPDIPKYRQSITEGRIVPVLEDYWFRDLDAFVYYHQSKIEQPKVRVFIDFIMAKKDEWLL